MIDLAFISNMVPDTPEFAGVALNRAANMFATNLVSAMGENGLVPSATISLRPLASFPREKVLWATGRTVVLADGREIQLAPFLNVKLLKQVTAACSTFVALYRWRRATAPNGQRVIVVYNLTFPPAIAILAAARVFDAKCVAIVNDLDIPGAGRTADGLLQRVHYAVQLWCVRKFDALQVCTNHIAERKAPGIPHVVVEGGVSPLFEDARWDSRSEHDAADEAPFTIFYAGALSHYQGVDILLQAFSLLEGNYRLLIAGIGPLCAAVEEAAAGDSRVEYLGFHPLQELLRYHEQADLFVCIPGTLDPGNENAFPSKLLDYLASGKLVVATPLAHIAEEYGTFLRLLDDETPEGLVKVISELAQLPPQERTRRGQRGREFVMRAKRWNSQGRKLVGLIQSLV